MKTKKRVIRSVFEKPSAYASPQAMEVMRRKKERRYVNEGSGRCQVFFVCF
jgi:hypothetical protein